MDTATAGVQRFADYPLANPIVPATERDLWRIWEARRLPVDLHTRDGRVLHVLFPGVANTDAGPDFVGAHLAFDTAAPRRGDVELHLEATSWERHGHHHDGRYDGVILHVVLLDDGGPAYTSGGTSIPLLALGPVLAREIGSAADPPTVGPCRQLSMQRDLAREQAVVLRDAGMKRFERRLTFWQAALHSKPLEDCVLLALLRSAGLGKNSESFAALAEALDGVTLEALMAANPRRAVAVVTAVLLGMSGLLEAADADVETRELWLAYRDCWPGRPLSAGAWRRFRVRPANLPESRLRYLAALAGRSGLRRFLAELVSAVDADSPPRYAAYVALLEADGRVPGRSWSLEALANVLLPLVAARAGDEDNASLAERAVRAYAQLPGGGQNAVLERMTRITGLRMTPRAAVEQQGLLHLWSMYCSRQLCGLCPLSAAR